MRRFILPVLLIALSTGACASLVSPHSVQPASGDECRYYDDAHLAWNAVATGGGALAAGAATVLGIIGGVVDSEDLPGWTIGLGITAAVGGLLSTVASPLSGEYARRYAERCPPLLIGQQEEDPVEATVSYSEIAVPNPEAAPESVPPTEPEESEIGDTVELPLVPDPEEDIEPGPGETGTGSDGLADDEALGEGAVP